MEDYSEFESDPVDEAPIFELEGKPLREIYNDIVIKHMTKWMKQSPDLTEAAFLFVSYWIEKYSWHSRVTGIDEVTKLANKSKRGYKDVCHRIIFRDLKRMRKRYDVREGKRLGIDKLDKLWKK